MHFGGPRDMPCGMLGNTKGQECGRPIFFWVTQRSLASTVYTSFKLVIRDFAFVRYLYNVVTQDE